MGGSSKAIKTLTEEIRKDRYDKLKSEGKLPTWPAIGRGMPTTVSYAEWSGQTKEESDSEAKGWEKADQGRLGGSW